MNRDNQEERLWLARRMRRAGVPLEIREDDVPGSCRSEVGLVMKCIRGVATQLNPYMCSFHILVKIISNRNPAFHISNFDLELPWQPQKLWLLSDPADEVPPKSAYTFWRMDSSSFPRKDVLNHLKNRSFELKRGHPLEGYLLWIAEGIIPKEFSLKTPMPAIVSVIDQYDSFYKTAAPLAVRRSQAPFYSRISSRNITGRAHGDEPVLQPEGTVADRNVTDGYGCEREIQTTIQKQDHSSSYELSNKESSLARESNKHAEGEKTTR